MGVGVDQWTDGGAHVAGWPTGNAAVAPTRRFTNSACAGVNHDQPRDGRAFLTGESEGRGGDGRDHLVEVGIGIDDDGVLAAHLRHHPPHATLPRLVDTGGGDYPEADGAAIR